jgi:hypothetical protein
MKSHFHLLQINLSFQDFRFALLSSITAFVLTMIFIPVLICRHDVVAFYMAAQ